MQRFKWIFLSLIFSHLIYAENNTIPFNFFQLESLSSETQEISFNNRIQIRGFLYQTAEGDVVLAREPDLKSCCVGSASKRGTQLLVFGDLHEKIGQKIPINLEGNLSTHPSHRFPYHLENAVIASEQPISYTNIIIGCAVLLVIALGVFLYFRYDTKS